MIDVKKLLTPENSSYMDDIYYLEEYLFGKIEDGSVREVRDDGYVFKLSELPYTIDLEAADKIASDLEDEFNFKLDSYSSILSDYYDNDDEEEGIKDEDYYSLLTSDDDTAYQNGASTIKINTADQTITVII